MMSACKQARMLPLLPISFHLMHKFWYTTINMYLAPTQYILPTCDSVIQVRFINLKYDESCGVGTVVVSDGVWSCASLALFRQILHGHLLKKSKSQLPQCT